MLCVLAAMREHEVQTTAVFNGFGDAFRWVGRPELGDALPPQVDGMLNEVLSFEEQEPDSFRIVMKRA